MTCRTVILGLAVTALASIALAQPTLDQPPNTWVKRTPLKDTPTSPRMGYETASVWDSVHQVVIRWAGHNQGGGGEQNAEVWILEPITWKWTLKEPNTSPPGVCCAQQNVFDPIRARYIRFPAFSGSHGWQWFREIYLSNNSIWTYDLPTNTWRNMRPLPEARVAPLRCASWDSDHQVVVLFGGENSREGTLVYDPHTNTWTRMNPPTQPEFRSGGNMAYDSKHKLHILFGAQFSNDPHTWAYDLAKNEWRDMRPPTLPPTDRNDCVLTYDSVNGVIIAVLRVREAPAEDAPAHLETWVYDAGKNEWQKMNPPQEPDPTGNRARVLMFAPELNVAILENRTHTDEQGRGTNEQQILTYRYADPKPDPNAPPQPPTGLTVTTTQTGATLKWQASPSPNVSGYAVYRGEGAQPWRVQYARVAQLAPDKLEYEDKALTPGLVYRYFVRAVRADGTESADSIKVPTQPPVVEDVVVSVLSEKQVEVKWEPPQGAPTDILGYHVERAVVEVLSDDQLVRLRSKVAPLPDPSVGAVTKIGPFQRLTQQPTTDRVFRDTVDLTRPQMVQGAPLYDRQFPTDALYPQGKPYSRAVFAYRVLAVNTLGVESGPSPYVLTIPSAPQWVFAKENGTRCQLKWQPNPEQGIRGYRVYRMDGRWDVDPMSRLTPDPIGQTVFTDESAGDDSRRYYIVAVDALGQEGIPSAPVWHLREWRTWYVPFIGEWHQ